MTKITHEAEVQRQHPRYRFPVKCLYNGKQIAVIDISVGGLGLRDGGMEIKPGSVLDLTLAFPFSGYELTLPLHAEVRYVAEEHSRIGLRFVDVSPRQHSLIRFVLDAYLAGDVVEAGDILEVVSRRNDGKTREVPARPQPQGFVTRLSRYGRCAAGYAGIAAVTFLLLGFVGMGAFERLYMIPAQSALITADLITVPAPSNGQLTFVAAGHEIKAGEPLLTIQEPHGNSVVIDSPCDCVVQLRYSRAASFVREGEPVLTLREKNSSPYITASISQDQSLRLYRGASAVVEYSNGSRVREAKLERVPIVTEDSANSENVQIKIVPGQLLEPTSIGEPVSVVFNTFEGSTIRAVVGKLQAAASWAGNVIADIFEEVSKMAAAPDKTGEPEADDGRRMAGLKSED
ncbi:alginate biosynthesis protein Alg44 [Microvirga flocculans]|uniref:Alginate biosynthesis protein Alg44 n=1 Tax=Microvirga flocculans TaxID=217168 RepID=A0A7W6ICQ1_9HYPH|nr:PilZ domain-containing protein [Microvirga flocculans]MBB4039005.1 alginate biosynthesis protein Alg44 [Microvirga flocculans]